MPGAPNLRRVFLSHSSKDREEVQRLYTELRRRGVPVWWDSVDLPRGRVTAQELERAAREAAGFAFYLTENAAQSRWVREEELRFALANQRLDGSFGIFPIFRNDLARVTEVMKASARERRFLEAYDLRGFHGCIVDESAEGEALDAELRLAATGVLRSLLRTLAEQASEGAALRIGAATRAGPRLQEYPLDLLIEWTQDFPDDQGAGRYPSPEIAEILLGALRDLRAAIDREWSGRTLRIVPQCHLSMAFALGFQFRRNSGFDLEVVNPHTGIVWSGPGQPSGSSPQFWSIDQTAEDFGRSSEGISLILGVSGSIRERVRKLLTDQGLLTRWTIEAEPATGPSADAISGLRGEDAHRAVRAVIEALARARSQGAEGPIHLYYAGPPTLAVLLGQQLSNLGEIRIYEWKDSEARYLPVFVLRTS